MIAVTVAASASFTSPISHPANILVMGPGGPEYTDIAMDDELQGSGSVTVPADADEVFLIVAAVPEHFGSNQTYGYEYTVTRN